LDAMSEQTVSLRNPARAAFLAWLIPGLGHFYQGRTGKGILYAVCILGLYLMGMVMGEGKIVYWRWVNPLNNPEKFCLYYLGQFFVGLPALPALIQSTLQHYGVGPILWGFMAEPTQHVLNSLQTRLGKLVEIGTIYTTVAGLLNILAIYDAYEGPAYQDYEEDSASQTSPKPMPATGLSAEGSA
jgi:TM2 domain-containing membrane protein YozV